jgi:hypothetical protein
MLIARDPTVKANAICWGSFVRLVYRVTAALVCLGHGKKPGSKLCAPSHRVDRCFLSLLSVSLLPLLSISKKELAERLKRRYRL